MMDVTRLCMGCMEPRDGAAGPCPLCGFYESAAQSPSLYLRLRTELQGQYVVGRVLGHGGFGITYLGWDLNLQRKVAVKEYLPAGAAVRVSPGAEVVPASSDVQGDFHYGLERYLEEARTVARFSSHPAVVSVLNFFRAKGTAYLVMEYLEGHTFEQYLEAHGNRAPMEMVWKVMEPVIEALHAVHQQGILHRDISPDNLFLTNRGQVKVLDFGAARYALGQKSRNLSVILKEGFAPVEQYHSKGNQGPWTDVYACGATMYRALTGQIPPGALDRLDQDSLMPPSRFGVALTEAQESAILKALAVRPEDRFYTAHALREALTGTAASGGSSSKEVRATALPAFVEATFPRQLTGSPGNQPASPQPLSAPLRRPQAPPAAAARPLPRWIWGPAGGILLVLILTGAAKQFHDSRQKAQREQQREAARQRFAEEVERQRQLDADNARRRLEREQAEAQLRREEEELRLRQEELARLQQKTAQGGAAPPLKIPSASQPSTPAPQPSSYEEILRQAQQAARARNYPLAAQLSGQALALEPGRPEAYASLGWVELYGTGDFERARQNYQHALSRGGAVWFRVYHDHQNGRFQERCLGDLGISRDSLQFVAQESAHSFQFARSQVKESQGDRSLLGGVDGAFHIRLRDNRNYHLVSVVHARPLRDLILELLR